MAQELLDLPGIVESRLPPGLQERLPAAAPPAPWLCRVRAVLWTQRAVPPLPSASPFAGRLRGRVLAAVVDYLDTPVGPYREVLVGQLLRRSLLPTVHVPFIAVDSLASIVGGRANWHLPKTLASFSGDAVVVGGAAGAGGCTVSGDDWTVTVRATVRGAVRGTGWGPRLPVVGPLLADQGLGRATTGLRGTARLARVEVVATGPTLSGWLGAGTHRGAQVQGTMLVGAPRTDADAAGVHLSPGAA